MKNIFLILLFSVVTFCATAQVTIPDETARFFLEQREKVKVYERIIPLKDARIANLEKQVLVQKFKVHTYESDSASFRGIINTNGDIIKMKDIELGENKKEIRSLRRQRNVAVGVGVGAAAGSFVGQPLIGGLIGGGVGLIVAWIKR